MAERRIAGDVGGAADVVYPEYLQKRIVPLGLPLKKKKRVSDALTFSVAFLAFDVGYDGTFTWTFDSHSLTLSLSYLLEEAGTESSGDLERALDATVRHRGGVVWMLAPDSLNFLNKHTKNCKKMKKVLEKKWVHVFLPLPRWYCDPG